MKLLTRAVEGIDAKDLKSLVDDAKKSLGSGIVAIASASPDGKAGIVVGVTDDLTEKYSAVEFVRVASVALGGKGGGGRPDLAQAGRTQRGRDRAGARRRSRTRCAARRRSDTGEQRAWHMPAAQPRPCDSRRRRE